MPNVRTGESKEKFVSRCMSDPTAMKERPNQQARLGLCYGLYKTYKKKKQTNGSNEDPIWEDVEKDKVWFLD